MTRIGFPGSRAWRWAATAAGAALLLAIGAGARQDLRHLRSARAGAAAAKATLAAAPSIEAAAERARARLDSLPARLIAAGPGGLQAAIESSIDLAASGALATLVSVASIPDSVAVGPLVRGQAHIKANLDLPGLVELVRRLEIAGLSVVRLRVAAQANARDQDTEHLEAEFHVRAWSVARRASDTIQGGRPDA